jgi:hypothetical protein
MSGVGRCGVGVCRTSQIDWISCAPQGKSCTAGCPGFAGLDGSFSKVSYLVDVDVLEFQTPDVRNGYPRQCSSRDVVGSVILGSAKDSCRRGTFDSYVD